MLDYSRGPVAYLYAYKQERHNGPCPPFEQCAPIAKLRHRLDGCTVTISVLDNELDKVLKQSGSEGKLSFHQRVKFLWNEEGLKGAMEELRGQREALNLLVTVVQRQVKLECKFIDIRN